MANQLLVNRLGLLGLILALAGPAAPAVNLDSWMARQAEVSRVKLLKNLSPRGAAKGAVVASPSRSNPNYFFHWVRDAALVMRIPLALYVTTGDPRQKAYYGQTLTDYVNFVRRLQVQPTKGGLGEPKYMADGTAFNGPWGRPQNDGPALRATLLTQLAWVWIREGKTADVRRLLYGGGLPARGVIKRDLEYVAHRWQDRCFDLWEEISGTHFYTRMAQRKALYDGARLAKALGDTGAAHYYAREGRAIEAQLGRHWNGRFLMTTLDRNEGIDYKTSQLDASTVLAAIHSYRGDGVFGPTDPRVQATFSELERTFTKIYPVNGKGYPATAIGRYPEDRYNGNGTSEGNPWFLLTAGFGEFLHRAAKEYRQRGQISVTSVNFAFFKSIGLNTRGVYSRGDGTFGRLIERLQKRGDAYIARAGFHSPQGNFAEQINRHTGFMQGAPDLTWSHAAFLTAYWSR